jgi:hypothetical protein
VSPQRFRLPALRRRRASFQDAQGPEDPQGASPSATSAASRSPSVWARSSRIRRFRCMCGFRRSISSPVQRRAPPVRLLAVPGPMGTGCSPPPPHVAVLLASHFHDPSCTEATRILGRGCCRNHGAGCGQLRSAVLTVPSSNPNNSRRLRRSTSVHAKPLH